jgi:hypothetical protein
MQLHASDHGAEPPWVEECEDHVSSSTAAGTSFLLEGDPAAA